VAEPGALSVANAVETAYTLDTPAQSRGASSLQRGASLPIVLALTALLQVAALAQADTAWVALHTAGARHDRLVADAAAEAGLVLCTRWLQRGAIQVWPWQGAGEPAAWRAAGAFDDASAGAAPHAQRLAQTWPGARAAPQCLVEARPASVAPGAPPAQILLMTVRGVGMRRDTQRYLQQIWRLPGGAGGIDLQHALSAWRSVAAAPESVAPEAAAAPP